MLLKLAWRNLWRNKLRTSIILTAMMVGLMGVSAMMGFMTGMLDNMVDNAIAWQSSHIQVHNKAWIDNPDIKAQIKEPQRLEQALDKMPEVKAYSSRFVVHGMLASARSSNGIRINGINAQAEALITPLAEHIQQGQYLDEKGRNPVLVSEASAKKLRLQVGSKVVLTFTNAEAEVTGAAFRVRGIFSTSSSAFDKGNVYVRQQDLIKLAGMDGVHEMAILLHDAKQDDDIALNIAKVKQKLQNISFASNSIRDWQEVLPMVAAILGSMGTSNFIMLGIFVIAMGFGIINIMLMSVFERRREFGVLMAVGMEKASLFQLIILETTLLGITGASLGLLMSMLLIAVLQTTGIELAAMAEGLSAYGVDTLLYPRVAMNDYLLTFVTVIVVTILAAFYPAWQILKQRPVDAMSEK